MPSLLLHADDACWVPDDQSAFVRSLAELGLIGCSSEDGYFAGQQFLGLVMFLGCSPQVSLDPSQVGDGQPLCRLLVRRHTAVRFFSATPLPGVRCPDCRSPAKVVETFPHDSIYTCPDCGRCSALSDLDWRQGAGYGRLFIEIIGVYPHEAVPSDRLLDTLSDYSGTRWRYCYC